MQERTCPICGPKYRYKVKYKANFDVDKVDFAARNNGRKMIFRMVECVGCGLIFSNPIFPESEIKKLYENADFIDSQQLHNMVEDYWVELMKYRNLFARGGRLLEVGCANGMFLKKAIESGIFEQCAGVEPGEKSIASASKFVKDNIVQDYFREEIFSDNYFDVIVSFQVFDHILDPNKFLWLVKKYLKPRGILLLIHHNVRSPLPFIMGSLAPTFNVQHIHLWSKSTMGKIISKNGMEVVRIENMKNKYNVAHVVERFPMPVWLRTLILTVVQKLGLGNLNVKLFVENMVCVSRAPEISFPSHSRNGPSTRRPWQAIGGDSAAPQQGLSECAISKLHTGRTLAFTHPTSMTTSGPSMAFPPLWWVGKPMISQTVACPEQCQATNRTRSGPGKTEGSQDTPLQALPQEPKEARITP